MNAAQSHFRWRTRFFAGGRELLRVDVLPPRVDEALRAVIGREWRVGHPWYNPDVPLGVGTALQGELYWSRRRGVWMLVPYNSGMQLMRGGSVVVSNTPPYPAGWILRDGDRIHIRDSSGIDTYLLFKHSSEGVSVAALTHIDGSVTTLIGLQGWKALIPRSHQGSFADGTGEAGIHLPSFLQSGDDVFGECAFHVSWESPDAPVMFEEGEYCAKDAADAKLLFLPSDPERVFAEMRVDIY